MVMDNALVLDLSAVTQRQLQRVFAEKRLVMLEFQDSGLLFDSKNDILD